jgi:hypothetical protein
MEPTRCSQLTKAGAPCRGKVAHGDRCLAHSQDMKVVGALGGRPRKAPPGPLDLTTHDKIRRFIEETAQKVAAGTMPARTGQVLASLARTAQASVDNDQERKLADIEAKLEAQQGAQGVSRRRGGR